MATRAPTAPKAKTTKNDERPKNPKNAKNAKNPKNSPSATASDRGDPSALAELFRCSFCGSSSASVDRLIGGPGVFICDRCVGQCVAILDRHGADKVAELVPPWETMSADDMLAALPAIATSAERVQVHIDLWVQELRDRRVTWAQIGEALGMTRQSAWERLARKADDET